MAFGDPNDEYQQLSNLTPATASSSSSLQGLGGFLDKFRSQSRLGMLDMDIIGQRKGAQPAYEPGIPSAPGPSGPEGIVYSDEYKAKKAAEKEVTGQVGPKKQPENVVPVVKNPPTSGTFMPSGSSQQQIAQLATQKLQQMQQARALGLI